MAIKQWVQDGKTHYQIDVCAYSRLDNSLRKQKRESGCLEDVDPETVRKKLNRIELRLAEDARREVMEREGAGILWSELVKRWIEALTKEAEQTTQAIRDGQKPGVVKGVKLNTARGYIQSVNDFTEHWMKRPAQEISPADVEDLFRDMTRMGYSACRQYNAKVAISRCFRFGILKRLLKGISHSPTFGFGISRKQSKRPEILNHEQVAFLLSEARERKHFWSPIWEFFYHSGARSGEGYELRAKDIDLTERSLILERKYNFATKMVEPLKDKEWREVPINDDMFALFMELGVSSMKPDDYVLPRDTDWKHNQGARVLRAFCEEIGITSICFHTLRACWATHLLRNGVDRVTVQKMGGWSDLETMERYIRLAGIELVGATDSLSIRKRGRPARGLKLLEPVQA